MKRLSILLTLLMLTGCGSLNVQVSVLQPQIVEQEMDRINLRRALPSVLAQTDDMIKQEYHDLATLHLEILTKLAKDYDKQASPTAVAAAKSLRDAQGKLGAKYDTERDDVLTLIQRIRAASGGKRDTETAALISQLQNRKGNFLHQMERSLKGEGERARAILSAIPEDVQAAMEQHASDSNQLLIGDGNITQQPAAYVIANAQDKDGAWAPIFDRSYGAGQWGKTDVAIKMETRGVFTIKGLTFDASQTARVASKVGAQALMIGTQFAGVPLKSGTFSGDGAALANGSVALQQAEQQSATAEAKIQDKKDALMELATLILAQRSNFDSGVVDKMKAALTSIDAKFTSTKTRLTAN